MPSSILSNIVAIINPSAQPRPQNSSENNNTTLISVSIISIIIIGGLIALSVYIVRRNRKIKKQIKILKTRSTKPQRVKVIKRKKNNQKQNNNKYSKKEDIEKNQYIDDEQEKQKVEEEGKINPMCDLPIDQNESIKISHQLKPIEHSVVSFEPTSINLVKFRSPSLRLPSTRSLNVNQPTSVLPVNLRPSLSQKFEVKPIPIRTGTNYTPLTKPNFLPTQSISNLPENLRRSFSQKFEAKPLQIRASTNITKQNFLPTQSRSNLIINKPEYKEKTSIKNLISKFETLSNESLIEPDTNNISNTNE
jgi:hypothetical protein